MDTQLICTHGDFILSPAPSCLGVQGLINIRPQQNCFLDPSLLFSLRRRMFIIELNWFFFVHPLNWFVLVEWINSYFHAPTIPEHRCILRAAFQGQAFHLKVLLFHFSLTPQVFSRYLQVVLFPMMASIIILPSTGCYIPGSKEQGIQSSLTSQCLASQGTQKGAP